MRLAGEAHGDGERHPGLQRVGIVGQIRLDAERARYRIDAVVDRADGAVEGLAGKRRGGSGDRLADGRQARCPLPTSKETVTVDMSSRVVIGLAELMRSPTEISVRPMVPAKAP